MQSIGSGSPTHPHVTDLAASASNVISVAMIVIMLIAAFNNHKGYFVVYMPYIEE